MGEEGREIVNPVEGEGGENGIKAVRSEREGLSVWVGKDGTGMRGKVRVEGKMLVAVEKGRRPVGGGEVAQAGVQRRVVGGHWRLCGEGAGDVAGVGAEVKNAGEVAVYVLCSGSFRPMW